MKNMMEDLAQNMQNMQAMVMSNMSANVAVPDSVVKDKPKKQSQTRSSADSVDSDGSKHSSASHKSTKLLIKK